MIDMGYNRKYRKNNYLNIFLYKKTIKPTNKKIHINGQIVNIKFIRHQLPLFEILTNNIPYILWFIK